MAAQSRRNKKHPNKSNKSSFWMTLLIVIVVMFLIGFIGMGMILRSINGDVNNDSVASDSAQETGIDNSNKTESDTTDASDTNLQDVNATFDSIKLYAVQVSSLSDETAANNAVDMLGGEGIPVTYAHIGSYYKLFAGLTTDEALANQFVKKIVERYPKYKDAYVTSIDMSIEDLNVKSSDLNGETISKTVAGLIKKYDSLINNAQLNEEISSKAIQNVIDDANNFFDKIVMEEGEGESIVSKLKVFNEALSKLNDRNANVKEYNKLWLNTIIEQ